MKCHKPISIISALFISCQLLYAQNNRNIKLIETGRDISIRGVSIPDSSIIWVSGNVGLFGISKVPELAFVFKEVNNINNLDFRDIYALNDSEALILNAGSPAYIFRTTDGGENWKEVYKNTTESVFFNGMDFWDKQHGIAFSDPVNNKFLIITTHDGGETWQEPEGIEIPGCLEGEAGFAASGSSIACGKNGRVYFGTGGKQSRLFISDDFGVHWRVKETPVGNGRASSGIFSVEVIPRGRIFIAGGDYKYPKRSKNIFFYSDDEGTTWTAPAKPPGGYRSCLLHTGDSTLIATGINGTDISADLGVHWESLGREGFHAAATCTDCRYVIFSGNKGRFGILTR